MKHIKRTMALLLAVVLVLALSIGAFAAENYSITVTNTNESVSISGNTYRAYKIFDATYSGDHVAYTVSKEFEGFTYESKSGDDLIAYLGTLENNSEALDKFAKAALAYAAEKSIQAAGSVTATGESATIALDAPGYYLVTGTATPSEGQTVTAACSLTTAKPTATVNPKVDAPSIDKKIVKGATDVDANTANIGDSVNYKITSSVPNMQSYEKYYFVIEDTLSKGLTFNDDLKITIGGTELAADAYTLTNTPNGDGTTSLEIVFKNFIQYKNQVDAAITVTYSATLNQDAVLDPVEGNSNKVKLIYSNNPNATGEGVDKPNPTDPVGETPESETKTYVTGVKLTKVDANNKSKTLTGAKFEIKGKGMKVVLVNKEIFKASSSGTYYMLKDGTYTTEAPSEATKDKYDSTTQTYEKVTVVDKTTVPTEINATGYVDANGVLTFEGLGEGEYEITELIAPQGYNLLKDSITLVITATPTPTGCTWTVTENGTALEPDSEHLYAFSVENNSGTELPSTGGIGTTIFYIVGSLLAVGAVILLVTKKRMGKAEN